MAASHSWCEVGWVKSEAVLFFRLQAQTTSCVVKKKETRGWGRRGALRIDEETTDEGEDPGKGTYFKNCPKSSQTLSQPGHLHTP